MALLAKMGVVAAALVAAPAVLDLDVDGYVMSTEFLSVLASALSALFTALFGVFVEGWFGGGA